MLVSAISGRKLWSWDYRDHCCFWNLQQHRNQAGRKRSAQRAKESQREQIMLSTTSSSAVQVPQFSRSLTFRFHSTHFIFHSSRCSADVGLELDCGCGDGFWAESWDNHISVRQVVPTNNITQKAATIAAHWQSSEQSCRLVNVRCCGFFRSRSRWRAKGKIAREMLLSRCEMKWNEGEGKVPQKWSTRKKSESTDSLKLAHSRRYAVLFECF